MAIMTVIYKAPANKAMFEEHYNNVHIPLAKQLPRLRKYELSKGSIASPTAHSDTFFIAHLHFDTLDSIEAAFNTEIGKQCAADRQLLAPGNNAVQIYLYESEEVK